MSVRILMLASIAVMLLSVPSHLRAQDSEPQLLLGRVGVEQLIDVKGWFEGDFLSYQPEIQYIEPMRSVVKEVRIVCVLATWCGDSKREVPRFLKILQALNVDPTRVEFYGVDRSKVSPGGETLSFGIEKVPTFLFFRDGRELGRIVEQPIGTLEKDMMGILIPPPPAPPAVTPAPSEDEGDQSKRKEAERQQESAPLPGTKSPDSVPQL